MKITLVFKNSNWTTITSKVNAIQSFFSSLPLDITVTSITDLNPLTIPWVSVGAIGGITNTLSSTTTVDPTWFANNVSSLAPDSDIIVYCIMPTDIPVGHTSIGIMQGKVGTIVQCCIFGIQENDHGYVDEVDQGNAFVLFTCHEISHALYLLQGDADNTHAYFYTGQPTKVLGDLKNGKLTKLQQLVGYLKQLVSYYQEEITIIKPVNPINIPVPQPQVQNTVPISMITKWATAISIAEGARKDLNNPLDLKVSTLTESWGASNGMQATDGGWIAKFETYEQGFTAGCNFLKLGCEDELKAFHQARTLETFMEVFAGNPPQPYIQSIADYLGVPLSTDVSAFLS